jgi:hypothetical protein
MSEQTESCLQCRFYFGEVVGDGTCRRYAPRAELNEVNRKVDLQAAWPFVESDDWCGEFEPNDQVEPSRGSDIENN